MDIFSKFDSREALLRAVDEAVVSETADGSEGPERFYLKNDAAAETDELRARIESEQEETRQLRQRLADAESRIDRLTKENARLAATNEEFSNYNPEKQRDEINRLLEEVGRLKADNNGLNEQIAPLNALIADYKRKEDLRTIDQALIDEAARLGVRPEAMRDVMFRRSMLTVSDLGTVQTKEDGVGVAEFMKAEYDASPLWHPQSQGGGSAPGDSARADSGELYREAVRKKDFEGMIANAPEFKGLTLRSETGGRPGV